ncbi:MAG: pantetheine-phosphate adenylyltransferase [Rhodobacteraceae bacterium]|nr:pantetheine-phosphate adenylyltransferase [Paracoccaceae bacterium]
MRVGLYPGTFDPITFGHHDICQRAMGIVDKLIIGVAVNPDKQPFFDLEERVRLIKSDLTELRPGSEHRFVVRPFGNLLVDFAREANAGLIIRGLRAVSDFELEFQMVGMNRVLDNDIETVFLMADGRNQAISSRLVKEIALLNGDVSSFVSATVAGALRKKIVARRKGSSV